MKNYEDGNLVLNEAEALERFGGDKELYEELLSMFVNEPQFYPEIVSNLIHENSLSEAASQVHRLKGTAGTIGAEQLYHSSADLESLLKGKTQGNPAMLLEQVTHYYSKTIDGISEKMKRHS